MANFDDLKLSVEALSGGKNTVILDDLGMPSIMVRIPKFLNSDVLTGATQEAHHMFIVDTVEKNEVLISKYQNIVMNGRAYSLPFKDPRASINFDEAKAVCEAKGAGHHLMTNAEWAGIALWCKKNGFMPRGNNNYGADHGFPHEKGVETHKSDATRTGRVATGSGPAAWAHDNTNNGIFDLNGNVWEWNLGLRLKEGEIQIIPYNNAAAGVSHADTSTFWKAIMPDGSFVDPGTAGTLKFDYTTSTLTGSTSSFELSNTIVNKQPDEAASGNKAFETLTIKTGLTAPNLLKLLGLFPIDASHGADSIYIRNLGERLPLRGGSFLNGASAGVFALALHYTRAISTHNVGFRSAFVNL